MISVIITTFEQARSLESLLHCLRAQDVDMPFEVIVCDDGSSFHTYEIASSHVFSDLDIRYIWQPKRGNRASRSKNNGIRCARGDVLVFLDGDILVDRDFLRNHVEAHVVPNLIVCNPRLWLMEREISGKELKSCGSPREDPLAVLSSGSGNHLSIHFEELSKKSSQVERDHQRRMSSTKNAWMSCIGFSFSVRKDSNVVFDERFEGWGPEDREIALRLVRRHGFVVSYRDDIVVLHLECHSTGRPPFSLLPNAHSAIVAYMRNILHFRNSYPAEDLSLLVSAFVKYRFNEGLQIWELRPRGNRLHIASQAELDQALANVERWFANNGVTDSMAKDYLASE
jgi:glycosyltransferase involved in cell wall biosynthesis